MQRAREPVTRGVANVPVIMQMEALECGAACLSMVLAYYGKWIPLERTRYECGVSRDGSNAANILKAARNFGLQADAYRYEPEELREDGSFPCIVHWEFNHFVVLKGFKGDRVYLNDPARGSIVLTMAAFDEGFTGICLMMEPDKAFVPEGRQKSMTDFARKRLSGSGSALAFVALTALITAVAGVIGSGFSRVFLDQILTGRNENWLYPFLALLSGVFLIQITAAVIQAVYFRRIQGKMAVVGSSSYLWKILRLPMEFFSQRMAGDIQQRQTFNASIAGDLVNTIAPLGLHAAMMVFYLAAMLRYSPLLTAVGLAAVLINVAVSQYISQKRVNITRVMLRDEGNLAGAAISTIDLIETIKASGAENGSFARWSGYQASVNTQAVRYEQMNCTLGLIPTLAAALSNTAVLSLGAWLCMDGRFTAGMILAFQVFLTAFMDPAQKLVSASQIFQEMRSRMERIEDVMEYPDDARAEAGEAAVEEYAKLSGSVSLSHVTFGYSRLSPPLVEDFNLELKPGDKVALVGPSGCGKSTLSKLISGMYQPWSGEILFDGKPIGEIDRNVFTGSVSVVDQDITLFEDTIENNIKMWDNSIEDFEMILAARDAGLHEDIMQRNGGYQYRVSEGGRDFSGGQRQRMEIARVLAHDPTLIILDEATSALDAKTEAEVVDAVSKRGLTCIVIAHRLSTIRDCDEILVLDHGRVVERGTHAALMALHGAYARLVASE